MIDLLTDIRQTIIPSAGSRDGPLPALLLMMTMVTGLVDAFSYLALGHVFVANMTGNILFLAFAVAGAPGFSIAASLVALAAFMVGALAGGRVSARWADHRGRLVNSASTVQASLLAVAVILAASSDNPVSSGQRYPLIVVLGIAMGLQNAAARSLGVPNIMTTNVLTTTITAAVADSAVAGGPGSRSGRRATVVAAMLVGGVIGAACVVHVRIVVPLVIALVVSGSVVVATRGLRGPDVPWARG